MPVPVTPAKAEVHFLPSFLDPGLRRDDVQGSLDTGFRRDDDKVTF